MAVVVHVMAIDMNKLPQIALCNWHIFFPPIHSTSTPFNSVTMKLEALHSCETFELKRSLCNARNKNTINITNLIFIFILFNKYFKWHFCFLISLNCKHFTVLQLQAQHSFSHAYWRCKPSECMVNWMCWIQSSHQHHLNSCMGTLKLLSTNHIIK